MERDKKRNLKVISLLLFAGEPTINHEEGRNPDP
jgi:hypothetical protein